MSWHGSYANSCLRAWQEMGIKERALCGRTALPEPRIVSSFSGTPFCGNWRGLSSASFDTQTEKTNHRLFIKLDPIYNTATKGWLIKHYRNHCGGGAAKVRISLRVSFHSNIKQRATITSPLCHYLDNEKWQVLSSPVNNSLKLLFSPGFSPRPISVIILS